MRTALLLALALVCGAPAVTHADEQRDEAKAHHDLAKVLFSHARYREALGEFDKAYQLAPIPDLLFNIGRCHELLGDTREAAASYRRYLAAKPDAEDRAELSAHLAQLEGKTSEPPAVVVAPVPATPPVEPTAVNAPSLTTPPPGAAPPRRRSSGWIAAVVLGVVAVGVVATAVALASSGTPTPITGNARPGFVEIQP